MADSAVRMARGASFLVFNSSIRALIGIIAFAFVTRLITKAEMGIMAVLLMITSTCQLACTLGLPNAATKFISESLGKDELDFAGGIANQVLRINLLMSFTISLLCFVLSEYLSKFLFGSIEYTNIIQFLSLNIFFASLLPGLTGILLGLKRLREIGIFGAISFFIQQTFVVIFLLLGAGLIGIVSGWLIANAFNCVVFFWTINQSVEFWHTKSYDLKILLRYSWPLYPVAFVSLLDNWFDRVLLLGYSLSELGSYNVAFKAFGYLYAIPIAIADGFFPHFSELKSREGLKKLSETLKSTSRYLALVATPLSLGLASIATPLISLFASRAYESAGEPLVILCIATAVSVFGLMLGKVLLILEETKIYASIVFFTILAGLFVGILTVPMLGPLGASIARALTLTLTFVCLYVVTSRKIDLHIDLDALWKSWVAGLVMVGTLIISQTILNDRFYVPIHIIIGAIVYLSTLRILRAIVDKDIDFVRRFLGVKVGTPISRILKIWLIA
ncbi:oligosaccharide flippase family protein [[Eubacterium] cellulosolvens]